MSRPISLRFLVMVLPALFAASVPAQPLDEINCPYVLRARKGFKKAPILHKYQTAPLPVRGWYAYTRARTPGIFWSELAQWQEKQIPGVSGEVEDLQITGDGSWIAYSYRSASDTGIAFVHRDGSGRSQYKVQCAGSISWYRNSPLGDEIVFFEPANSTVWAMKVTLGSSSVEFGQKRALITSVVLYGELAANGNHVFLRSRSENQVMYTIPNGGRGTTDGNSNRFYVAPPRNCGLTLSPDGSMGLSNQGRVACLDPYNPGIGTGLHKGFLVVPFVEAGTQGVPTDFEEFAYSRGVSLNYAPEVYKEGRYPAQEFHHWYWSDEEEWVVGIQQGNATAHKGVWLVNWKANEWFMLSPEGNAVTDPQQPAVYLEPAVSLSSPHRWKTVDADSSVLITANVSRLSNISSVEFFADNVSIGSASSAPFSFAWASHPDGDTVILKASARSGGTVVSSIEMPVVCAPRRATPVPDSILLFPANFTIVGDQQTRLDVVCFDQYGDYLSLPKTGMSWSIPQQSGTVTPSTDMRILAAAATLKSGAPGSYTMEFTAQQNGGTKKVVTPMTVRPFGTDWVRVNFRAGPGQEAYDPTASPAGWYDDVGYRYGLRTSGYTYGFDLNFPRGDIGRKVTGCTPQGGYESIVYCTGALMTATEVSVGDWNMAVPKGAYRFRVASEKGDRAGQSWLIVEGKSCILNENYTTSGIVTDTGTVQVLDGLFTVKSGRKPSYLQIAAVELQLAGSVDAHQFVPSGMDAPIKVIARQGAGGILVSCGRVKVSGVEVLRIDGKVIARGRPEGGLLRLPREEVGSGLRLLRITEQDKAARTCTVVVK